MWIEDKRLTRQLRCSFREKTAHRGSVLGRNVILWMDWWRRQVVAGWIINGEEEDGHTARRRARPAKCDLVEYILRLERENNNNLWP